MPVNLKLAHLEQKPKKIILAPTFRDPAGLAQVTAFANAVDYIRKCIANGTPLRSTFYSKGAGKTPDYMLANYGIMHLHLGNWNTNELLWLVQYPEHVVFLELSDHRPFRTTPPGILMHNFHLQGIRLRESEIDQQTAADLAAGKAPRLTFGMKRRLGLIARPKNPSRK